jgi:hypothetical protein
MSKVWPFNVSYSDMVYRVVVFDDDYYGGFEISTIYKIGSHLDYMYSVLRLTYGWRI